MTPILETLPYDDIVVWDAKQEPVDYGLRSRYVAAERARHDLIYFQDDDVIFRRHAELMAEFDGRVLVNMDEPWIAGGDYYDCSQVGGGSLVPRGAWEKPLAYYLTRYPDDSLFRTYADFVTGTLWDFKCVNLGFEIRDEALDAHRICMTAGAKKNWLAMRERCRQLREDEAWSRFQLS